MNDTIFRADAIALASGGCHPANLAEELAKLPSAQRWIPCKEALPEKCGVYLVSGGDKVWVSEWVRMLTVYGWINNAANPTVTAWMPLPEPYEPPKEEM